MADATKLRADWCRADVERGGLPRYLADAVDGLRRELCDGAGFCLVSGITGQSVAELSDRFSAFGERLGSLLPQNERFEEVVEIADFSDEDETDDRGLRSAGELTPHTDPPPLIALYCVRGARRGGGTTIVNALRVHEQIRREDPDALEVLKRGFHSYLPAMGRGKGGISDRTPVFAETGDGLSCMYYRPFIEQGMTLSGSPLSDTESAALDLIDTVSKRPENRIEFDLKPGDALVLNNFRVLHARDVYEDWPEKSRRRLLLRLWLAADWLPEAPPSHPLRKDTKAMLYRLTGR